MNIPSNIYEKLDENIVGELSPHAAVHANALNTKGILYTGPLIRSNLKPQAPGEPWAKLHDNGKPLWPTQGNGKRCWARQARELLLDQPSSDQEQEAHGPDFPRDMSGMMEYNPYVGHVEAKTFRSALQREHHLLHRASKIIGLSNWFWFEVLYRKSPDLW